jgi:hypothetical protein
MSLSKEYIYKHGSPELRDLIDTNDWSSYAKIKLSQYIPRAILFWIFTIVSLCFSIVISPFGLIPMLVVLYFALFNSTQVWYYYNLTKNPDYEERWWSKILYGGK